MNFEVKKATEEDVEPLTDIRNEALAFKLSHGDKAWEETPFTKQEMLDAIARNTLYLVLVDGKPAGSVVVYYEDEHTWGEKGLDGTAGYIGNLAVRDDFRGQGLGERIVEWAANKINDNNKLAIRLSCPANNAKLCSYYAKQDFEYVGINPTGSALYERAA